ncbi:MAG: glycosyltransferase family 4 protein [Dysgonamonadaceae bacterium]|jgi:glycosyltransferase involved in cell wall biosynthesis|nr:glycosyltransferase family 4 protein [Dysgonamonadaceae bacterium]
MKICVFGTRGFPDVQGGVEKHCEYLYPLLASKERKIMVFRRKSYVKSGLQQYQNIDFIDLPSTRVKGLETVLHSFLATLRCLIIKPDIVHIHNIGPALFSPLLKLLGIKVVLTFHSPNYEHEKWDLFSRNILKLSEKIALSVSDSIIFVSNAQRNKYGEKILQKSVFIPNGIINPVVRIEDDYLKNIGVSRKKYILAVGRITPEKGFDYLIRSFEKANPEDYHLVIAGGVDNEKTYSETLKNSVRSKKVVFAGFVTGKPLQELYSNAALFVLPSYNEGMSIVLLEAMSYSLPIIASDIPANKELNLDNNSYFPVGNERKLAEKLSDFFVNPIESVVYDMDKYRWETIAEQTAAVYEKIQINQN